MGIAQRRVDELWLEGVRRWAHVADLEGHVTGRGLATVVTGAQGEA